MHMQILSLRDNQYLPDEDQIRVGNAICLHQRAQRNIIAQRDAEQVLTKTYLMRPHDRRGRCCRRWRLRNRHSRGGQCSRRWRRRTRSRDLQPLPYLNVVDVRDAVQLRQRCNRRVVANGDAAQCVARLHHIRRRSGCGGRRGRLTRNGRRCNDNHLRRSRRRR